MEGKNGAISPVLLLVIPLVLLIFSLLFLKSRRNSRVPRKLPPGYDGWTVPGIGETPAFMKNPFKFLDQKREKYGAVFRTSLFGQTSIVLSSPESARFVLVEAQKSFGNGYRAAIGRITDPAMCFTHTETNFRVRRLIASTLGPENVHRHIPAYDALVLSVLDTWEDGATLNTFTEMETMTLKCFLHLLWGQADLQHKYAEVGRLHTAMSNGYLAPFPINLPFTAYGKALKASGEFQQILTDRIAQAREEGSKNHDVVSALIESKMEDGFRLSDEQIRSVITSLVFAGYRSTAITLAWVFKFLGDNPEVLSDVKEEHMAIRNAKVSDREALTWDDVKKMSLTMKVIKETQRLAPFVKFMPRVSLEDVEHNGYVIPKGWPAYVSYHFHMDPNLYPDPLKFDPSRFNEPVKPSTFIPFGSGRHLCVGFEFALTMIPLIIHRVVTNFSFELDGEDGVIFWPAYMPKNGYPLKIRRLN